MTAATLALELLIMIGIGYFVEKSRMVGSHFSADLSSFVIKLALPCLIIQSMQVEYSVDQLKTCGVLLLLGVVYLAVSFTVGFSFWRAGPKDHRGRIMRFGLIVPNFTFMGIPVMETLYGSQGVFYFVIFLVPLRIALYSFAKPLLTPPHIAVEKQTFLQKLKGWFSPPMVGVIIGLTLYISGLPLPEIVAKPISWLAGVCSPLGMILCGVSLGKYPARALLRKSCFVNAALRCLLMPGVFLAVGFLLGLEPALAQPMVICAAMPIASTLAAFTIRYEENNTDAHFESAGAILCSTVLSAATIPLWSWALSLLK